MNADGSSTEASTEFATDHFAWAMKNLEFVRSMSTPEKGREYVEAHIND
jgi:hypothetical protein